MDDDRRRVVIEGVSPEIDAGRFAVKRTVGENVEVEADVFCDGHDGVAGVVRFRGDSDADWGEAPLEPLGNDRWRGVFTVRALGRYRYTIEAWVDAFSTWREDLKKRVAAGQNVDVELRIGARLVRSAAERASGDDAARLAEAAAALERPAGDPAPAPRGGAARGKAAESPTGMPAAEPRTGPSPAEPWIEAALADPRIETALDAELSALVARYPDRRFATTYARELEVVVDPERARFSAWYELFPRSTSDDPDRHGTFRDVEQRLPYVAELGFDVLYLSPIHPIGRTKRKGKNNAVVARPDDVGSPWAIGAAEGGHKAIHPDLGTAADFRRLVERAREQGIEVALDIAFQCSPDHPWLKEHPEWFRWRPDDTVQYAENPPKKYEDIFPLDFETESWEALWEELKGVFLHWIGEGVRIFRVDNPHTKPFPFWEWLIGEVKREHPDVIFLSEAFTRPKVMYRLAKLGFTQSYTYFAWRNTAWELTRYMTELTRTEVREYFRPNLWPNTPDILTEYLQTGGRAAFMARLGLAATLGASYGIYGPPFELMEHAPREPGSEEYLNSEKYEIRQWALDRADSLRGFIARVNRIRRENPALRTDRYLHFHACDNPQILLYSKRNADASNVLITAVNLDPYHVQSGWTSLDLDELELEPHETFQAHDLLTGSRFLWEGRRNYLELNPHTAPIHILRVERRVRTEHDFEYYM